MFVIWLKGHMVTAVTVTVWLPIVILFQGLWHLDEDFSANLFGFQNLFVFLQLLQSD